MISGVSEEQYEMIAAGLGALARSIEDGSAGALVIIGSPIMEFSIDLSAPFMRRYWIMQLRVIQNQIEQRAHGSLEYPPESEVAAWADDLLRERA